MTVISDTFEDRSVTLGKHIVKTKDTVRKTAKLYGISKSTVHKDVTERLYRINRALYNEVQGVLLENKAQRHIRGGIATREKFLQERTEKGQKLNV